MNRPISSALLVFVAFTTCAVAQNKAERYIEFYDCPRCELSVLNVPAAKYPSNVGYGAHDHNGIVSIQVKVNENGTTIDARAVSGHPFFRPSIEAAALNATFKPRILEGKGVAFTAIIQYQVVSTNRKEILPKPPPIINGMAVSLPKPIYPESAKISCASGYVDVKVHLDEMGNVETVQAINGNELLRQAAQTAAKQARFTGHGHAPRAKSVGRVRYNFPVPAGCPIN